MKRSVAIERRAGAGARQRGRLLGRLAVTVPLAAAGLAAQALATAPAAQAADGVPTCANGTCTVSYTSGTGLT